MWPSVLCSARLCECVPAPRRTPAGDWLERGAATSCPVIQPRDGGDVVPLWRGGGGGGRRVVDDFTTRRFYFYEEV